MKKIYILLILLTISLAVSAQFPAHRTSKTIVADVLAQMPARNEEVFNSRLKDLSSTGEDGVLQLVQMMAVSGNISAVEYALSGLSHYVSADGREQERLITSNAYLKALDQVTDREIRAFVIRQLEVIGKDEAVAKLSTYLDNKSLSGPAARALSSINTSAAQKVLVDALSSVTNSKSKQDIVLAVADMQIADAEKLLKDMHGSTDANLEKTVLYALSRVGTKASFPYLSLAASKDNYTMTKDGANEAYIALIKHVLSQGDVKDVEKAAKDLMKKAEKAGQTQTRIAALEILMAAKPAEALKLVQNALKDEKANYRYAALDFASKYADRTMYTELIKSLKKSKAEVQVNILDWLDQECDDHQKRQLIASLGDTEFINLLTSNNTNIKQSSAQILSKTASDEAIINLASLLNDADVNTVKMAAEALSATKGDISSAVAPVISTANTAGKIAGLQLLAKRKSTAHINVVLEELHSSSSEVKAAAYTALKDVVTENNLDELFSLLEKAEPDAVPSVQQAISVAIQPYSKAEQSGIISGRMDKIVKSKQYLYYPVLASTGEPKALDMIVDSFIKENGKGKDAAFRALLDWKGFEAADKLYAISKDASATTYFDRALDRYIQLVSDPQLAGEERRLFLANAMNIAKKDSQRSAILKQLGNTGTYTGMLLAGQYLDDKPVAQEAAGAVMNIALGNKSFTGKNVEELLNKVIEVLDNPDAGYQQEAIRKHLSELVIPEPYKLTPEEAAEGYNILFDGTSMDQWTGNTIDYMIEGNCISLHPGNGHGGNLYTKKEYGNFIFRFEFRLTPGANNGLGIRTPMEGDAAYVGMELQILDNEAPVYSELAPYQYHGSVYGIMPAERGYLKPIGEWNYQEVIANGDNIKVILNGTVILDGNIRTATKNGTADKRNHPGLFNKKGHIAFLGHGSPVKFRNIRVKELKN